MQSFRRGIAPWIARGSLRNRRQVRDRLLGSRCIAAGLCLDECGIARDRLGIGSADGRWQLTAWGKNLSDELDMTWQFVVGGVQRRQYLPPRTYGLNFTVNW